MRRRSRVGALAAGLTLGLAPAAAAAGPPRGAITPRMLHAAYDLPVVAPTPQVVALVEAYDSPTVVRDLATFGRAFALPTCGTPRGCFRKVNQRGRSAPLPPRDLTGGHWITEAALGSQTVHAICQNCRLLLVEADSEDKGDLAAAVDTAVRLGASEVVTSYAFGESAVDLSLANHYDHPGVAITAATGDLGFSFGTNFPASYPGVVAVGGTLLSTSRGLRTGESVWKDARGATASGCSTVVAAPGWQADAQRRVGCDGRRSVADVAAVAAPGVPLYSSTAISPAGERGWFTVGGTSLSSPVIAATFALAGGVPHGVRAPEQLYAARAQAGLRDIVRGANGSCSGGPICTARAGYDGPTGLGTPRGLSAFRSGPPRTLDPAAPHAGLAAGGAIVRVDARGRGRIGVTNGNPFALRLTLRLRAPPDLRVVTRSVRVPARRRGAFALRLAPAAVARLRRRRSVRAWVSLELADPVGNRTTLVRFLRLEASAR